MKVCDFNNLFYVSLLENSEVRPISKWSSHGSVLGLTLNYFFGVKLFVVLFFYYYFYLELGLAERNELQIIFIISI